MKEWFKAKESLLLQGVKSVDIFGNCRYRGDNGTKCFVGHLIADEHYTEDLEGYNIGDAGVRHALLCSGVNLDAVDILAVGQAIHDSVEPEQWEEAFNSAENKAGFRPTIEEKEHVTVE